MAAFRSIGSLPGRKSGSGRPGCGVEFRTLSEMTDASRERTGVSVLDPKDISKQDEPPDESHKKVDEFGRVAAFLICLISDDFAAEVRLRISSRVREDLRASSKASRFSGVMTSAAETSGVEQICTEQSVE